MGHSSGSGSGEEEWTYLVSNTLLMPWDVSLYFRNDSDSHIQLKYGMVVTI